MECLIVDDNKVAIVLLKQLLEKTGKITIAGECEDAISAHSFLQKKNIDLLFLDIEMPEMSGLELLKMLPERPLTILTTAKENYAVEAFELNIVDYLVKPFSLARVMQAIDKASELLNNKNSRITTESSDKYLFIKDNKSIKKVDVDEILYLEAKGDYVRIQVADGSFIVHSTLKTFEDKFQPGKFLRVHRSYVIAVDKIDHIEDRTAYIRSHPIPISISYKDVLLQNLNLL